MRRKVKAFFNVFLQSITLKYRFFRKLQTTDINYSLRYFFILILLLYLLFTITWIIKNNYFYKTREFRTQLLKTIDDFPENLSIFVTNGQLKTNYDLPYFMWLNLQNKKFLILVVDESGFPEKINQYNSLLLFTKNQMIIRIQKKEYSVYPLKNTPIKINKKLIEELKLKFSKLLILIPIILPVLALFVIFFTAIISSLILSVFVYIITRFINKHMQLKKIIQFSFHAMTLPLIIFFIALLISRTYEFILFIYILLSFTFIFSAVYKEKVNSRSHSIYA